MKALTISLIALLLGAFTLADDTQAARLGGGHSLGAQRQVTPPPKQVNPPAQQHQPAGAPHPAGSGWLLSQGGFGSAIGVLLMALLAGVLVVAVMRLIARGRPQGSQLQYSGFGD